MKLIDNLLKRKSYNVRTIGDARFVDQKCTPDVVCIIADCVYNLKGEDDNSEFTVQDIWGSRYFIKNVKEIFKKPSATNPTTRSEYDKFIQQPLRLLAYAGVLCIDKRGNKNYYRVIEPEILEYISIKDRNAYVFLYKYFVKVLSDSGLLKYFEAYKSKYENGKLTSTDFTELQNKFIKFIKGNTPINGTTEIKRIYPKILNVYASQNNLPGSVSGRLSKSEFAYTDLMYGRENFRDVKKAKGVSRQEFVKNAQTRPTKALNVYLVNKAMERVRKMHVDSEVRDQWGKGDATQVHHIFPKSKFPQLAHYMENLIKLTPQQHFTKAHPNNKTDSINTDYQLVCLIAKCNTIEKSLQKFGEQYYRKESFVYCINTGLTADLKVNINFRQIKQELASIYNDN
jgi:hypothetical protein